MDERRWWRRADLIGGWFGTGAERGIAVVFTVAGLLGIAATFLARSSGRYRIDLGRRCRAVDD